VRSRGGCVFIPAIQLCMGWSAYRAGSIRGFDLRVWLVCRIEVESRRGLREGQTPRYSLSEMARRVGAGEKRVRSSLRRLEALGLVSWSPTEVCLATSPEELSLPDLSGFWEMFEAIPNRKRLIPIPRRILRFMAHEANPSIIATVFAHLIRCLYFWPDEGFKASGTCKASWVASIFGISLRSVKAARKHLEGIGWLIRGETSQRRMNSFGPDVSIDLDWKIRRTASAESQPTAPAAPPAEVQAPREALVGGPALSTACPQVGSEIAPPPADSGLEIAPPRENKVPPTGMNKNQDPASGGKPTGFSISERGVGGIPTLKHVVLEDLAIP
jgi:hypothetical protein